MKLNLKQMLVVILGIQASFSLAGAQEADTEGLRLVENLSAQERTELQSYLDQLRAKGYEIDTKKHIIAIDKYNQVILLKKEDLKRSIYSAAGEPSCMSGGTGASKQ